MCREQGPLNIAMELGRAFKIKLQSDIMLFQTWRRHASRRGGGGASDANGVPGATALVELSSDRIRIQRVGVKWRTIYA